MPYNETDAKIEELIGGIHQINLFLSGHKCKYFIYGNCACEEAMERRDMLITAKDELEAQSHEVTDLIEQHHGL
jgi:hypothetical protein